MSLSESDYAQFAARELEALVEALDRATGDFEAELASDILTVEFTDGTKYVINSHVAARQIWMAAERQAWHFDYDSESARWIAKKSNAELWRTVEIALTHKLGQPLTLKPGG